MRLPAGKGAARAAARTALTGQGWAVLALAALLIATLFMPLSQPTPLAAALGVALLGALGVAFWSAPRSLAGIRGDWLLPAAVHALEEVTVGASLVAVDGAPPLTLDAWQPRHRFHGRVACFAGLTATASRPSWSSSFPKRGRYQLPPLTLRTSQPLGLVSASAPLGNGTELIVLPALGRIRREFETRVRRWLEAHSLSAEPGDDEVAHLRDYRPGDHPHAIHWKASARRRALLVMERNAAGSRHLALVVDTTAGPNAWKLERLISVAATLVDYLCGRGWTLTLYGHFAPDGLRAGRAQLLEALALAEAEEGEISRRIPAEQASLVLALDPLEAADLPAHSLVLSLGECDELVWLPARVH